MKGRKAKLSDTEPNLTLPQEFDPAVPAEQLQCHPQNAREGDIGAIYQLILANKFYGALLVQKSTNRILVGNHRYRAGQEAGIKQFPVLWVDVDDRHALQILLGDNRSKDLASYNNAALAELLQELSNDGGLEGTGYDSDALENLLHDLAHPFIKGQIDNPNEHWQGMPEFQQENQMSPYQLIVHFATVEDRQAFSQLIGQSLTEKTKFIWYPPQRSDRTLDLCYVSSES